MTDNRPERFFGEIAALLEARRPFALGTVVHTSGSTPQKAGARAIFLPDGRVIGTLGGGCMEAEARRRALELISDELRVTSDESRPAPSASPSSSLVTRHSSLLLDLHLDDDFGWDDGLICGGSAQIFLQAPAATSAYAAAIALKAERRRGMLVLVVTAGGSADVGRTLLVPEEGPLAGGLDDGALAEEVAAAARGLLREGGEAPRRLSLAEGSAIVFVEPILPRPVLLIMGAGHIGTALTHYAARIGFEVVVVDDRASFANRERLPDADQVMVDSVVDVARRWPKTPETYVVLVTRGHRNDAVALREVIGSPCAYIGMIGSRRKVLTIFEEFLAEGIATPEQLAQIHAPIGLDIGALTVDEIAVSIAAELIAVRRQGSWARGQERGEAVGCQPSAVSKDGPALTDSRQPTADSPPLTPGAEGHAHGDHTGGGRVPADGDAEAALAVRQRERDRAGRPLAAGLPDRRRAARGRAPRS